jgi:hypothetical protein
VCSLDQNQAGVPHLFRWSVVLANPDLIDQLGVDLTSSILANGPVTCSVRGRCGIFRSRTTLQMENLALRHQLCVLERSVKHPKLTKADCLFWAELSRFWADWRATLVIVKPETVIAWHRLGFRLFWTWKTRHRPPGRLPVAHDVRELIRRLSRENPLWGAPRVHGERLKIGIDICETSVGKYLVRPRRPPSQTWRTFP